MVLTKKFSEFIHATEPEPFDIVVGLANGANAQTPTRWITVNRPSTPYDGQLGYNTEISEYEYFNELLGEWLQLGSGGSVSSWRTITAASVAVVSGNGIVADRTVTPVQVELPLLFEVGDEVAVMGVGAGGWSLVANTGTSIVFGSVSTSIAGSINSDIQTANIFIRGLVKNTTWVVTTSNSNPSYL